MRHERHSGIGNRDRFAQFTLLVVTALAVGFLGTGVRQGLAKKPPREPVDTGVIYYYADGDYYAMAPDGSGKTLVLESMFPYAEPSELLHGGERWFLTFVEIPGETYPDGRARHELAAVSESDVVLQLSDDPTLQLSHSFWTVSELRLAAPRWSLGDTRVSFAARRWDLESGIVFEGGIYAIDLDRDVAEGPSIVAPYKVAVDIPLWDSSQYGLYPDIYGYDWSPDGSQIVFSEISGHALYVAEPGSVNPPQLIADYNTFFPRWSINDEIVFGFFDVYKVTANGTGQVMILAEGRSGGARGGSKSPGRPIWSPNGINIAYTLYLYHKGNETAADDEEDIIRVAADGDDATNLTRDVELRHQVIGWRAE